MAIRIEERFSVRAPAGAVWEYLVDPRRVVTCLPGAELLDVADERTYHGTVKVKVGAVTVSYRGRVFLTDVDAASRTVRMQAEGRESGGAGSAKMTMESRVSARPDGVAEVSVQANVDVVGRLVQLGRGMIEQVAHQLFQQFSACVRATLEAEGALAASPARAETEAAAPAARAQPVRAVPLLFKALWAWILTLFGRGTPARRP